MSFIQIAKIEFHLSKNCFISIPKSWNIIGDNNSLLIFKLKSLKSDDTNNSKDVFVSCNSTNASSESITINGLFANKIGLSLNDKVLVSYVNKHEQICANCEKCYLKPITENDWEILGTNCGFIENNLLNQIRVISPKQVFPIWINEGNICVFVEAYRLMPHSFEAIVLNTFTELIVSPHAPHVEEKTAEMSSITRESDREVAPNDKQKDNEIKASNSDNSKSMMSSMFSMVKSFLSSDELPNEKPEKPSTVDVTEDTSFFSTVLEVSSNFNETFRVHPLVNECNSQLINTVFISKHYFDDIDSEYLILKLTNIISPVDKKRETHKTPVKTTETSAKDASKNLEISFKDTIVVVKPIKNCFDSIIYMSDNLRRQLGIAVTSRVMLSATQLDSILFITQLTLHPIGVYPSNKIKCETLLEDLKRHIENSELNFLLLFNGTLIKLCDIDFITQSKSDQNVFAISVTSLKDMVLETGHSVATLGFISQYELCLPLNSVSQIDKIYLNFEQNLVENFCGYEELYRKCFSFVKMAITADLLTKQLYYLTGVKSYSLLLYGPLGSGKTYLLDNLVKQLNQTPHYVYVQRIECKGLKGKRIDSLQKSWTLSLSEALHRQPSLVIFEDLDVIASAPSKPEQEVSGDTVYSERVAYVFISLLKKLSDPNISFGNQVAVIATAKSKNSLFGALIQTRGHHTFHQIYELTAPNLQQRVDIISSLLSDKFNDKTLDNHINFNVKDIALKCNAYLPIDLSRLVDRAIHNCALSFRNDCAQNLILSETHFNAAFDGFSPLSLRGADLRLESDKKLSDIGGLDEVKNSLMQTLLWPLKYPILFSKLPIKPQSSVLLFGAPGTGKTLIVEAISNECDINFIAIKGPELLSKYIGASEQSIRLLFKQAENAKPCILFFDEFDALAPRRGHDSTGVTDRIVNQLLTQMDGFEALQTGVYVLAATSRPDLVDPALLRPGRFDKCVHCSLPDESERLAILEVLSAKLSLSCDIDLKTIASQTPDFTGADLHALLYNAQLEALNQTIASDKQHNNQQMNRLDSPNDGFYEFIAHMPTLENGFSRQLTASQQKSLIKDVDAIKASNEFYITNANNNSDDITSTDRNLNHDPILISNEHMLSALSITKPSISESQRKMYEHIYDSFCKSRGQSFNTITTNAKKVTLA